MLTMYRGIIVNMSKDTYTKSDVLGVNPTDAKFLAVNTLEFWAAELLSELPAGSYVVIEFYAAPDHIRSLLKFNGGDEDWLIVTHKQHLQYGLPYWLLKTDSCEEPDEYVFDDFIIYVGSHA